MSLTVSSSALQGWFEIGASLWYGRLPEVQLHLAAQGHPSVQCLMPLCRTGAIHSAWSQHHQLWAQWELLQGRPDCPVRKLCVFSRLEGFFSLSTWKLHDFKFPCSGLSQKRLLKTLILILHHCGYFALFDPQMKRAQYACVHTQLLAVV